MNIQAKDPALALAECWQRDFPLCGRPFAAMGGEAGLTELDVLARMKVLKARDVMSRIGAAIRPNTIGASTLAAMRVPPERLDEVAALVSADRHVNHNYARDHVLNLWFVVTGPDRAAVEKTLRRLERQSGVGVLDLTLVEPYHIDLGFRLDGRRDERTSCQDHPGAIALDDTDRALVGLLEDGLALIEEPYRGLAEALDCDQQSVLERIAGLIERGAIARFGCILRHRSLGFRANAMAVWDVPDEAVRDHAVRLAAHSAVTLCYRRVRRKPQWSYNLFAMVHGRQRGEVEATLGDIASTTGLKRFPAAVLFSTRCYKQTGARYFSNAGGPS